MQMAALTCTQPPLDPGKQSGFRDCRTRIPKQNKTNKKRLVEAIITCCRIIAVIMHAYTVQNVSSRGTGNE